MTMKTQNSDIESAGECFTCFFLLTSITFLILVGAYGLSLLVVLIPFSYLNTEKFIQFLLWINPFQLLSLKLGPFTLFFSPLSLCPSILPNWFPFQKSYVAVTMMDSTVTWPNLFLNLHLYPSVFLYLPPLSSFHRLSSYTVTFTLASASVLGFPLELIGLQVYMSLWSLLTCSFSDARVGPVVLPGVKSNTISNHQRLEPPSNSVSVRLVEAVVNIVDTKPQRTGKLIGGALDMMSLYGFSFVTGTLWYISMRYEWF